MKAEEFEKEFLSLSEDEQMSVLRKILPGFCRTMKGDPKKVRDMFSLLSEESGPMENMISMMGMMGRKGGSCCW